MGGTVYYRNVATDNGSGFGGSGGGDVYIENTAKRNQFGFGFFGTRAQFIGNRAVRNAVHGFAFSVIEFSGLGTVDLVNNVARHNGWSGFSFGIEDGPGHVTATANTATDNGRDGFAIQDDPGGPWWRGALTSNYALNNGGNGIAINGRSQQPLFVNS